MRAAALLAVAGCNALSGVNDFTFDTSGGDGGGGSGGAHAGCGDGRVELEEACDDGNVRSGDGCDAGCEIEEGFGCAGSPSVCGPYLTSRVGVGPGLAHALPDDQRYDGSIESMECMALPVTMVATRVVRVEVLVGLSHSWLSDLVIKVVSPEGTVTTLLSRAGIEEPDDGSSELDGDGSNLVVTHPITFRDDAASPAELMGVNIDNSKAVCRDDGICAYGPSPGKGPGKSLADFELESPSGDWLVCVADADDTETGTLDQARITVVAW
ncbi:uncharacterized protein CMC5_051620 [Chondromyces crocatus]|uniref:P/Homo B domain-containing protein n=2 Tax=Chondromyces crocatus TaxID=52 RepID=A0A0K1EJG7_CHOCO|nr:uncharacterized protein CMC5_051620 [Chondromyces crocatus]